MTFRTITQAADIEDGLESGGQGYSRALGTEDGDWLGEG